MREKVYHDAVMSWLLSAFSPDAVEHEYTLESGRRPDFVVRTPFGGWVIEVENSAADLYNAIGQATVYAEETGLDPVIVFPADDPVTETFDGVEVENV